MTRLYGNQMNWSNRNTLDVRERYSKCQSYKILKYRLELSVGLTGWEVAWFLEVKWKIVNSQLTKNREENINCLLHFISNVKQKYVCHKTSFGFKGLVFFFKAHQKELGVVSHPNVSISRVKWVSILQHFYEKNTIVFASQ